MREDCFIIPEELFEVIEKLSETEAIDFYV